MTKTNNQKANDVTTNDRTPAGNIQDLNAVQR